MRAQNLLHDLPDAKCDEQFQQLLQRGDLRMERIVSWGQASPDGFWYDQSEHEWVLVVTGAARLRFADEPQVIELQAGSYLDIPAHRRHRVEWTSPNEPTVWLAIFWKDPADA